MNRVFEWIKKYSKILFVFYMGTVIWVLVLKFPTGLVTGMIRKWMNGEDIVRMSPQWVPFKTIISYVKQVQSVKDWFFKNLACNIIMFMPYGCLTPLWMKKHKYMAIKVGVSAALVSVGIELFQFLTALGLCDVDDVILNVVGAMLGYCIYKLARVFMLLFHI